MRQASGFITLTSRTNICRKAPAAAVNLNCFNRFAGSAESRNHLNALAQIPMPADYAQEALHTANDRPYGFGERGFDRRAGQETQGRTLRFHRGPRTGWWAR
jgi:hypothetical protein